MKKLLLASDGSLVISRGYQSFGIPNDKLNIAYITTAAKGVIDKGYLKRHKDAMRRKGLRFEELDIEGKGVREFKRFLEDKNLIHIEGGNTFYLLKALRENGLDTTLIERVKNGLAYVGTSAGAYIACPTIEVAAWGPIPKDRCGVTDYTALNLVPFVLKVHYTDDMKTLVKEKISSCPYKVRILRDGQGILVEGSHYQLLGKNKEVKL